MNLTDAQFKTICDLVFQLTYLRWKNCNHLAVENLAPEIMQGLLKALCSSSTRGNFMNLEPGKRYLLRGKAFEAECLGKDGLWYRFKRDGEEEYLTHQFDLDKYYELLETLPTEEGNKEEE